MSSKKSSIILKFLLQQEHSLLLPVLKGIPILFTIDKEVFCVIVTAQGKQPACFIGSTTYFQ